MKRIFFSLLLSAFLFAGCNIFENPNGDNPPDVDWYPVSVFITVRDKDGRDLLDPSLTDGYVHGTTLKYKGETFGVRSILTGTSTVPTKAYLARMQGLRLAQGPLSMSPTEQRNCYYLVFGEIDGALDLDEDLVITWKDGTEDVIHYHCADHKVEKQKDGNWFIDCERSWQLNKQPSTNPFQLVK